MILLVYQVLRVAVSLISQEMEDMYSSVLIAGAGKVCLSFLVISNQVIHLQPEMSLCETLRLSP